MLPGLKAQTGLLIPADEALALSPVQTRSRVRISTHVKARTTGSLSKKTLKLALNMTQACMGSHTVAWEIEDGPDSPKEMSVCRDVKWELCQHVSYVI